MNALHYLVWRASGHGGINNKVPGTKKRFPRFRHATMESAMTEANRLSEMHPESRFIVLAAVAIVGPNIEGGGSGEALPPVEETEAA